jgi:hypothetical protein
MVNNGLHARKLYMAALKEDFVATGRRMEKITQSGGSKPEWGPYSILVFTSSSRGVSWVWESMYDVFLLPDLDYENTSHVSRGRRESVRVCG